SVKSTLIAPRRGRRYGQAFVRSNLQPRSAAGRCCSLIPGLGVKFSRPILAGPTVFSAVGACPPHDGVRRRWRINVASAVTLSGARKKSGDLTTATVPAGTSFPAVSREPWGRCSLRGSLLLGPVELGSVDPHPMQNDGELRATATLALRSPLRLASLIPQAFSVDHFGARGRSCQERTFGTIASAGLERSGRDPAKPRQRAPEAADLRPRSTARRPLGGQAPGWISQLLQPPTNRPAP